MQTESLARRVNEAVVHASREIFDEEPQGAVALVFCGSGVRGEASFMERGDGGFRCLGDLEFLLVSKTPSEAKDLSRDIEIAITEALAAEGISVTVDVGAVGPGYFRSLKPRIFTLEIKDHARVVAGEESILEGMPEFGPGDIPRGDALNLLFNRMIEQMTGLDGLINGGAWDVREAHYRNIKMTLDIGASLLAFTGRYRTTYRERAEAMEQAVGAIDHPPTRKALATLPREIRRMTGVKLNAALDPVFSAYGDGRFTDGVREKAVEDWCALTGLVRTLWTWEMNRHLGGGWRDDTRSLLAGYLNGVNLDERVYGWLKFARKGLGERAFKGGRVLRLFRTGSPRALIYASAATLYFSLSSPSGLRRGPFSDVTSDPFWDLPEPGPAGPAVPAGEGVGLKDLCRSLGENWRRHVKDD